MSKYIVNMSEPNSNQSSTSASYNGTSVSSNGSDNLWSQVEPIAQDIAQNFMATPWNELPAQYTAPAALPSTSSAANMPYVDHNVQGMPCMPPSFMNIAQPRPVMSNGYAAMHPPRMNTIMNGTNIIHTQNGQAVGGFDNQQSLARFVSQASTWSPNKTSGDLKKQKRIRTAFTSQHMMELEKEYARTRYLDRVRRIELAEVLRLNERTIKIWFQNRRMKEKKDRAENLEECEEATTTQSTPEMSSVLMPMLIHEQHPGTLHQLYNQGGIYVQNMPTSSTSTDMSTVNVSTPMMPAPPQVQNNIAPSEYVTVEQWNEFQQSQLQVQQYPTSCINEAQELSSQSAAPSETVSSTNGDSEVLKKDWAFSWLRSINIDEQF